MTDRTQSVKLNNVKSYDCKVTIGVPQGTILGPLLLILYINELLKLLSTNIISYADDMVIVHSGNSWNEVQSSMNGSLSIVGECLASNQLSLNISKTVYMAFSSRKNNIPNNLKIQINGNKLNSVDYYKYLGVTFDSLMKWEKHIKHLTKTRYLIFVMNKLKYQLLPTTLVSIYYALFNSIASYGIVAWGGTYKKYIKPINSIQKRLSKIIDKSTDKKLLNIKETFIINSISCYHKNLRIQYINNSSNTRYKLIKLPKIKKSIGANRSHITAIRYFNKLPKQLKTIETSSKNLKNKITRALFH